MGLYNKKNKQVEPLTGDAVALNSALFREGFIDDETPLDQYNLNLLIRAIKESNIEIKDIIGFIENKPAFKDAESASTIPLNTPENSKKLATVEYIHNLFANLVLIIDGGTADTAKNESWGGPPR